MHEYIISGHPLRSYSERLGVLSSSLKVRSSFLFARLLFFGACEKQTVLSFCFSPAAYAFRDDEKRYAKERDPKERAAAVAGLRRFCGSLRRTLAGLLRYGRCPRRLCRCRRSRMLLFFDRKFCGRIVPVIKDRSERMLSGRQRLQIFRLQLYDDTSGYCRIIRDIQILSIYLQSREMRKCLFVFNAAVENELERIWYCGTPRQGAGSFSSPSPCSGCRCVFPLRLRSP